jgi:hypothetical protein
MQISIDRYNNFYQHVVAVRKYFMFTFILTASYVDALSTDAAMTSPAAVDVKCQPNSPVSPDLPFDPQLKSFRSLPPNLQIPVFQSLSLDLRIQVFRSLSPDLKIRFFPLLPSNLQVLMFRFLSLGLRVQVFRSLPFDLKIPLFAWLPHKQQAHELSLLSPEEGALLLVPLKPRSRKSVFSFLSLDQRTSLHAQIKSAATTPPQDQSLKSNLPLHIPLLPKLREKAIMFPSQ